MSDRRPLDAPEETTGQPHDGPDRPPSDLAQLSLSDLRRATAAAVLVVAIAVVGLAVVVAPRAGTGPTAWGSALAALVLVALIAAFRAVSRRASVISDVLIPRVRDIEGALARATAALREIQAEAQRLREDASRREQERSVERAMVEARTRFLTTLSHELRTPLNGVVGYLDLLARTAVSAKQEELIQGARASSGHVLDLVNDFLDFAKIDAGSLEIASAPFSMSEMLTQVRSVVSRAAAEKGLLLAVDVHPDVPDRVAGDVLRVRQVLMNLLSNAVKFTKRGRVRLRARPGASGLRLQPATAVWFDHEESTYVGVVEFEIEDDGEGIAPERLATIFDPFKQADAAVAIHHGGTGLGLAISRQLARAMGGDLTVTSEVGIGSTFRFHVAFSAAEDEPPVAALPPAATRGGLRVLLADDNAVNRLVGTQLLHALGHEAEVAEDGEQALERATRTVYDVIVMDMEMPRMDGLEATRRLRAGGYDAPILGFTAHSDSVSMDRCYDAGMDAVVHKPLSLEKLESALARVTTKRSVGRRRRGGPIEPERPALVGARTPSVPPGAEPLAAPAPAPTPAPAPAPVASLPPPSAPEPPLFEYDDLVQRVGGDRELARDVLLAIVSDSQHIMQEIEATHAAGDHPVLRRAAHTLKGCVSNIAAKELARRCAELERAAADADAARCASLVVELRAYFDRFHAGISALARERRAA